MKIFNSKINSRFRYSIWQLIEFENSPSVSSQKCRTSCILMIGFVIYSILATIFSDSNYVHGKVTNISIALFFITLIVLVQTFKRHTRVCVIGSFGICTILFFHFITEVDWTIGMDAYWLFILILPFITNYFAGVIYGSVSALSGLFLCLILFKTPMINYLQPYGKNMIDWFSIIYLVAMMAAALMEYELTSYQIEKKESDEKIAYFQKERTKRLAEQLSIYESNETTIRKYKHDVRHFNRVLASYIQNKEYEKASAYLKDIDSMLEQVTTVSFCDNQIVNELLTIYTYRCQKCGFKLRAKANVPDLFPMEETDLTSLVANALENALEAQRKLPQEDRFIQFELTFDGKKLKLITKNPYTGKIEFNNKGLPISTREIQSGIGTKQISDIAQKYSGVASFSAEEKYFVLKAVMTCM